VNVEATIVRSIPKPWGYEVILAQTAQYVLKKLHVRVVCPAQLIFRI
jgi:hypothetical protein